MSGKHAFTVGIEEEFFLVELDTLNCVESRPNAFSREIRAALGDKVRHEVLESMLEIVTRPHATVREAIEEVSVLRKHVADIASQHGLAILAAGTHPFADWREQRVTRKDRYLAVADSLQALSKRVHVCGLHVHVAVPDSDAGIDLMNRVQRFLPLCLALSASSPFWRGELTGLRAYRMAAYREIPRTGLPGWFGNAAEFERYVDKLSSAGFIADASYLWWAIRPSARYPTLELRIADSCTNVRDTGVIAALFQSLLHHLWVDRASFREWEHHHKLINEENVWQAVRHGIDARFLDPVTGHDRAVASAVRDTASLVAQSAHKLGCFDELACVTDILSEGTSAERQMAVFHAAREQGLTREAALRRVAEDIACGTIGSQLRACPEEAALSYS